jgi:hypothetical protein
LLLTRIFRQTATGTRFRGAAARICRRRSDREVRCVPD